jgi:hypothetical protein
MQEHDSFGRIFNVVVYARIADAQLPRCDGVRPHWLSLPSLRSRLARELPIYGVDHDR